jgi:hypothetical protein
MPTKINKSERDTWRGMIERCENPAHIGFKYYGARGITVCERWRKSFAAFLADMGPRPSGLTLDRIDPNGNYEPDNCRWITPREQRRNQRPYDESARVRAAWQNRERISKNRRTLIGQRFNRLVVIAYADTTGKRARWLCRCDCGAEKVVTGKSLRGSHTKSCGCFNREQARERAIERNSQSAHAYALKRWKGI